MGTGSDTSGCSLTHAPPSSNFEPAGVADERRQRLAVAIQRRASLRFAQRRAAGVAEPGGALRDDDHVADLTLRRDPRLQHGLAGRALLAGRVGVVALE